MAVSTLWRWPCCPMATEAQSSGISTLGGGITSVQFGLRLRTGITIRASGDLPNAAAEELELGKESAAAAAADVEQALEKNSPEPVGGVVDTWFYGSYKAWPDVHRLLTERNVKGVEWQEAYDLAKSGAAILIDVREAQEFDEIRAECSFGAPLFQLIQGNDLQSNLRRLGYALLTDFSGTGTKGIIHSLGGCPTILFREVSLVNLVPAMVFGVFKILKALQAVDGDKQKLVIVMCGIGGTLSTFVERKGPKAKKYADPSRRFGRPSRSLRAVFELQEGGFKNVSYLSGGLSTWIHQGLPTEERKESM